jgi:F420-dependent oxidoreductase-like protein
MKLGINLGFLTSQNLDPIPLALEAEKLGYHSVWVAEAWGSDAVSLLAWIGAKTVRIHLGTAVVQIPARSPAMTAMTAATLDRLSGGRVLLGLGASGPQVVEGWHGVAYGKPLARTRECVDILRKIWNREEELTHRGLHYEIPMAGGTGLGKPLKIMMPPLRPAIPIYLAAIGPNNIALAAEIADGWLPIFYSPYKKEVFEPSLEEGFGRRQRPIKEEPFDIAPTVAIALGDDLSKCLRSLKPNLALYVGGMGARGRNFYFDLACRYGYEKEATTIQELFLGGKRKAAIAAVPDALVDEVSLCGPKERIAERLEAWKETGVTTLICGITDPQTATTMAEMVL